jgi:hypothetical protein
MPCWLIKTVIAKIKTVIQRRNMPSCCAKSVIEFFVSLLCLALSLLCVAKTLFGFLPNKEYKIQCKAKGDKFFGICPLCIIVETLFI